jgi:branched-subunit amino acid aminotransferase/4-amino-4-deoxychorismate lyase
MAKPAINEGEGTNGRQDVSHNGDGNDKRPSPHPTYKPRTPLQAEYAGLDRSMVPLEDATVHFLNPTPHYGPGVFEGIRCYNTPNGPAVFRLHEHLERFLKSAGVLGVGELIYDAEDLRDAVCKLIRINNFIVAEAIGENLLLVRDNSICTAPRASILEGITRDSIMTLARDAGYSVVEERISRDQLYIADEVFVCGTAAEVLAVREIDYRKVGSGGIGPVASKLRRLFIDTVNGQNQRSPEWLDYMVMEPEI